MPSLDAGIAEPVASLTPYDSFPEWALNLEPPGDPAVRIPQLLIEITHGDYLAAEQLFIHTLRCAPGRPVPRDAAELEQHRNRIIQTRQSPTGRILDDWEAALDELDALYRLCRYIDEQGIAPHTHWIGVAAELGSPEAMVRYWIVQHAAMDDADSATFEAEMNALRARSIEYLERARDIGYVEAFYVIAVTKGGFAPGPYEEDHVGALAYLYAGQELRAALIEQRRESAFYDGRWHLETLDRAQLEQVERLIRAMEMQVHVYQHHEARELAEQLLARCCRP